MTKALGLPVCSACNLLRGERAIASTRPCPRCGHVEADNGGEYEHQHDPFTDENGNPFAEDQT